MKIKCDSHEQKVHSFKHYQHLISRRNAKCIKCSAIKTEFALNNTLWNYLSNNSVILKIVKNHEDELKKINNRRD